MNAKEIAKMIFTSAWIWVSGHISGGDHWIALNGKLTIDESKNTATFTSFDVHKGNKTITASINDFQWLQIML